MQVLGYSMRFYLVEESLCVIVMHKSGVCWCRGSRWRVTAAGCQGSILSWGCCLRGVSAYDLCVVQRHSSTERYSSRSLSFFKHSLYNHYRAVVA